MSDHPIVVLITVVSALIAIFIFVTGYQNLPQLLYQEPTPSTAASTALEPSPSPERTTHIFWTCNFFCRNPDEPKALEEFYSVVESLNAAISYQTLDSESDLSHFDIVIIDPCSTSAPPNEQIIKDYISSGGSIVVLADNSCEWMTANSDVSQSADEYATQLTKDYGITFFSSDSQSTYGWSDFIAFHPLTIDVRAIYSNITGMGGHEYLNIIEPSTTIVKIDGKSFVGLYDGKGTVVAIADSKFALGRVYQGDIASSDNFVFWRNMLGWLSKQSQQKKRVSY